MQAKHSREQRRNPVHLRGALLLRSDVLLFRSSWGLIYKTVRGIVTKSVRTPKSQVLRAPKNIQIYKTLRTHTHWRQFGLKCGGDRDAIWNAFLEVLGMHLIFL